ncbi:MAG TPA: GntR family transcriptional regulator [Terriglobia bacterium]|nr:GntR family transcriptional regulator [Terriglobia bacterium]
MNVSFKIPDEAKTMQQVVKNKIRSAILNGTFKPNEKLNQVELAGRLNVSRIPTREALRALEGEGLVRSYPHRGTVVSTISSEEIEELYEIRILLEMSAAQRALKRIDERQLQKARALQRQMVKTRDPERWVNLNTRFHDAIYEPAGWTRLASVINMLRSLATPYLRLYVADQFDRDVANHEHGEIIAALVARDGIGLKTVLRRHLAHSCQGIVAYLKKVDREETLSAATGCTRSEMSGLCLRPWMSTSLTRGW